MKVLLLTTHLNIGGIGTYVVNLAKKLKKHNVEVIVASSGGELTKRLEKDGIQWFPTPIKTKNEVHPKIFYSALKLAELVKKENIDIVHAHTRVAQVTAAFIRRLTGIPYVTTCHGIYTRRLSRRLFPCWGARVTAISEPVRESLVNTFKVAKKQALLLPNGIDVDDYTRDYSEEDKKGLKEFYGLNVDGVTVGSIARMEEVKGYQFLIRSIPYVIQNHPKTKFFLVGDGKYKPELLRLAKELDVTKHVVFQDSMEDVNIPLGLIDVFVHPPVYEEGFGLCILEGMSAGKPVVVTNVGGIYMLVKEGVNGFLVPPRDAKSLAEKIGELIENADLRKEMGDKGREIAKRDFSLDNLCQQMIQVYTEVIGLVKKTEMAETTL